MEVILEIIRLSKRLSVLNTGDKFGAKATLIDYHCSTSGKLDKLGLKSFRSVYIIEVAKRELEVTKTQA